MKFGKKVLSVFLASLVAVSAGTLSACSGNPNSAGSNGTDSSEKSEQQTGGEAQVGKSPSQFWGVPEEVDIQEKLAEAFYGEKS